MSAVLLSVFAVHLVAAISPGPAVLMTMRTAMTRGMARGAGFAFGVALGAMAWASAAVLGLATLFELAPRLLIALRIAGASYLIWMAWKMWRGADQPLSVAAAASAAPLPRAGLRELVRLALRGVTTQLANPKPAVFFGAVFVTLVPAHAGPLLFAAILGVVFVNEFAWNLIVARIFSLESARLGYTRLKSGIDRVLGGLLAALGIKIAAF
ncbi:Threonine/homoserine/homoserine lactone efflux protein [Pseudooceanicola antarcticus]|uniref:Threonine/homoserine/homoserine lactone efflux protein n=1 Tax=Pseudooceanicola antarcticus TaxID=1247613 RepID=A0A285J8E1_9RHOB|nr:LysE family transporter [Pseudooceanicola antarcticus]PJE26874.1 transporter [Pseudooceanicola antarcticus]SNY55616.1 Threonine/homoserine/homoserine lactone efflux protein [Pseudooceanicola antarcticus]